MILYGISLTVPSWTDGRYLDTLCSVVRGERSNLFSALQMLRNGARRESGLSSHSWERFNFGHSSPSINTLGSRAVSRFVGLNTHRGRKGELEDCLSSFWR